MIVAPSGISDNDNQKLSGVQSLAISARLGSLAGLKLYSDAGSRVQYVLIGLVAILLLKIIMRAWSFPA
jgi:hypothetical protein